MTTIDRFCAEYHTFHGISEARARTQRNLLREFEAFAGVSSVEEADDGDLRAFLTHRLAEGDHVNTVRRKRGMILPFFGWCFDGRLVDAEKLMRMKRVKNPRGATGDSKPKPYTKNELRQFWVDLDAAYPINERILRRFTKGQRTRWANVWRSLMHAQVNAIVHLALHGGMRHNEIFLADIDEIHYDNEYLVVANAARKNKDAEVRSRHVPVTAGLESALREWLDLRPLALAFTRNRHTRPWVALEPHSFPGEPLTAKGFKKIMPSIGPGYELHRMRHTCATEWLRSGMPLEQVQRLLGHSRLQQTLAYAEILPGDLARHMGRSAVEFQTAVGRSAA